MNLPLNIDIQQILLHLLNFTILFGILYFLLYSPVKKFMEKREQYYKDMDAEAKGELEKAKANNAESEKKLADLDNELSLMRKSMNADMDEAREQMISEAKKEAKEIINSANSKAMMDRERIMAETQNEIKEMVAKATEKIVLNSEVGESYDDFLASVERKDSDV